MIDKIKKLLETDYANENPYKLIFDLRKKYPEKFKATYEELKKDRIQEANDACDLQSNCVECAKCYTEFGDTDFIPCNDIRKSYGESIWWYK